MITETQYNYYIQFRQVIELFTNTGQYVGGCDSLFEFMRVPQSNRGCHSCLAMALIEASNAIKEYESNLQSM